MADWALHVDDDPWVAAATRRKLFQDGMVVLGQDLVPDSDLVRSRFCEKSVLPAVSRTLDFAWQRAFRRSNHCRALCC